MAPTTREPDTLSSTQSNVGATTHPGAKPQPAAAEIPVTVNGARTVEGSDKREPFSESTKTVLVFTNGAVIRLSSAVASGQLLFLTNEKTKKEVVCQVVKSKNYGNVSGYVELEFTEAAPGFWGLRFPTNSQAASGPTTPKTIDFVSGSSNKSLEEKIAETRAKTPAVTIPNIPKTVANNPVSVVEVAQNSSANAAKQPKESKAILGVPAQSPSAASRIPTLSEFLTKGESGPALKAPEKTKPENVQQKLEANTQDLKQQTVQLQDRLPSKDFAPELAKEKWESLDNLPVPAASRENPAPGTSTFDFAADEVKIPAWLEPLARNVSPNLIAQDTKVPVAIELDAKSFEPKTTGTKSSEVFPSESRNREQNEVEESSPEPSADNSAKHEAVFTLSGERSTPNFGSSLAIDTKFATPGPSSKGAGQGLILGLAAAALLFAAAGGWYWYSNQPSDVSANGITAARNGGTPALSNATAPASAGLESAKPSSGSSTLSSDTIRTQTAPQTIRTEPKDVAASASGTSKPAAAESASTASTNLEQHAFSPESITGPLKKPALGNMHLAAPKVTRISPSDNYASDAAPSLSGTSDAAGDSGSMNVLTNKGSQPAAPLPIGGNVMPAKLLSSVAPVYPQLARNQRLSGDVKLDALIGENGRVSAMKVISGPALLHQAAMDALHQWRYQPATLNGQPMAMHLTVTVQFKLQQ
jgi:TonB family protein